MLVSHRIVFKNFYRIKFKLLFRNVAFLFRNAIRHAISLFKFLSPLSHIFCERHLRSKFANVRALLCCVTSFALWRKPKRFVYTRFTKFVIILFLNLRACITWLHFCADRATFQLQLFFLFFLEKPARCILHLLQDYQVLDFICARQA